MQANIANNLNKLSKNQDIDRANNEQALRFKKDEFNSKKNKLANDKYATLLR